MKHIANALKVLSCVCLGVKVCTERGVVYALSDLLLCTGCFLFLPFCLTSTAAVVLVKCRVFIALKNMYNLMLNTIMYVCESCIRHVWLERRLF